MDFYELQKSSLILENIAEAKKLLVKNYAEKNKKNVNEIPEEIKKSIFRDPKFEKVLKLSEKNPGWVYPLTKFYIIDGADWEEISSKDTEGNPTGIYDMLIDLKQSLNQLPLKNVDAYARIIPSKEDERPGYEVLGDDLRAMQSKRKLKKIYDELIPRMKKEFDRVAASKNPKDKELIENLELFALSLEKLKPRVNEETGETETPFKEFKKKTGMRFSDSEAALHPQYGNPAFKDPAVAFKALVRECMNLIDNWDKGLSEYSEKIIELGLKAGIFYDRGGYLAMSARTPEAQRAVSGDTNFCINNDSTFWSYGDGSIQINIINGNLPKANKKYLLGVTVKRDGVVKNCAWKTNSGPDRDFHKSGINYAAFLKQLEYPKNLIDSIIDKFSGEVNIKLSLEKFYKESKSLTPHALIKSLIDLKTGIFDGIVSIEEWDQISGIVSFIVKEERNIPVSEFIKEFKLNGIFFLSAWEVFDYVVEGEYTKKDMEEIKNTTLEITNAMEEILKLSEKGKNYGISDKQKKDMLRVIQYREKNIVKFDSLISAK